MEGRGDARRESVSAGEVAGLIHRLRTEAGLSQRELAGRVGTTASVICRIEDSGYKGHSLPLLRRVAGGARATCRVMYSSRRKKRQKGQRAVYP